MCNIIFDSIGFSDKFKTLFKGVGEKCTQVGQDTALLTTWAGIHKKMTQT